MSAAALVLTPIKTRSRVRAIGIVGGGSPPRFAGDEVVFPASSDVPFAGRWIRLHAGVNNPAISAALSEAGKGEELWLAELRLPVLEFPSGGPYPVEDLVSADLAFGFVELQANQPLFLTLPLMAMTLSNWAEVGFLKRSDMIEAIEM